MARIEIFGGIYGKEFTLGLIEGKAVVTYTGGTAHRLHTDIVSTPLEERQAYVDNLYAKAVADAGTKTDPATS